MVCFLDTKRLLKMLLIKDILHRVLTEPDIGGILHKKNPSKIIGIKVVGIKIVRIKQQKLRK